MGDFSDLREHDVAFKIWLPEPVKHALDEISERSDLSVSVFLRQFLAIHCYGLYAFYQMIETTPNLFKDIDLSGIRYSFAMEEPPEGKKRVDTYWVVELGKNVAPIKLWIPKRMKADLKTLAEHVGLTPSNYVREILVSRLLGHGMLPLRPAMFKPFSAPEADIWEADQQVWREVSQEEFHHYHIGEVRTEWVDEDVSQAIAKDV
ncbi:MAG: hypothetical protein NTW85_02855 [Methylococcales bacterium]|nr:hypothetical protein [Methylococcales bacterium]